MQREVTPSQEGLGRAVGESRQVGPVQAVAGGREWWGMVGASQRGEESRGIPSLLLPLPIPPPPRR